MEWVERRRNHGNRKRSSSTYSYHPTANFCSLTTSGSVVFKERTGNLSNRDRARLDILLKAAVNSQCKQKHAASVYRSSSLLSIGINKSRVNNQWNNKMEGKPATCHAEVAALNQVEDARGCTVYVARVLRNGDSAMSRPCNQCAKELIRRGVSKVVYTTGIW